LAGLISRDLARRGQNELSEDLLEVARASDRGPLGDGGTRDLLPRLREALREYRALIKSDAGLGTASRRTRDLAAGELLALLRDLAREVPARHQDAWETLTLLLIPLEGPVERVARSPSRRLNAAERRLLAGWQGLLRELGQAVRAPARVSPDRMAWLLEQARTLAAGYDRLLALDPGMEPERRRVRNRNAESLLRILERLTDA
jgi:hypothetical protein